MERRSWARMAELLHRCRSSPARGGGAFVTFSMLSDAVLAFCCFILNIPTIPHIIVFVALFIEITVYVRCRFPSAGNGAYYQAGSACRIAGYEYVFGKLGMFGL